MDNIQKEIQKLYQKFLQRDADTAGLESFLNRHKEGMKIEEIAEEIRLSNEAQMLRMKQFQDMSTNFSSPLSNKEIEKIIEENKPWYHWAKINGIETKETRTSRTYQMWIIQNLPQDFTNKSVLDIGCADGYYSFLAESRNAKKILAIDSEEFEVGKTNYFDKNKNPNHFQILKKLLNSKIEYKKFDIYNVDKLNEDFDFVFMYGIYYHLQDLILALRKVSSIVKDSVFLSGHILDSEEPIMYYYDIEIGGGIAKQKFSPIVASPSCLTNIAKYFCNFKKAEFVDFMPMEHKKLYPHNHGSTVGKIGLFKFTK